MSSPVDISCDPIEREWTLANRGLDFFDVAEVLANMTVEFEDARSDCGEVRMICLG